MFWLKRKTFCGSYLRLIAASRAYVAGGYASRTRSAPSLSKKLTYTPDPSGRMACHSELVQPECTAASSAASSQIAMTATK